MSRVGPLIDLDLRLLKSVLRYDYETVLGEGLIKFYSRDLGILKYLSHEFKSDRDCCAVSSMHTNICT